MVDIKKLKIKRSAYLFEINRSYEYSKGYTVIEKNPFEKIMDNIFKKKDSEQKKKEKISEKKGMNPFLIAGAISLVIIALLAVWIITVIGSIPEETPSIITHSVLEASVLGGEIVTYGLKDDKLNTASIIIEQNIEGYDNIVLTLSAYTEEPPYQVYILDEPRDISQTTKYSEFKSTLIEILKNKGVYLNTITINDLKTVQKGAMVIVPSGRIPEDMIKGEENSIKALLSRGVNIIYIGKEFESSVTNKLEVIQTDKTYLDKQGIIFEPPTSVNELPNFFQPQYSAKGETDIYYTSKEYGSISVIKHISGTGYLILVPQTLDAGWKMAGEAAEDISKIVLETRWIKPKTIKIYENLENKNQSQIKTYYSEPFEQNQIYLKAEITAIKNNEEFGKVLYFNAKKEYRGELYITGGTSLVSSSISGKEIRIKSDLKEQTAKSIYPDILVFKDGEESKRAALSDIRISTQTDNDFDVFIDIPGGEHTAYVTDEIGNKYAAGYIDSVKVDIILKSIEDNKFTYSFEVNGIPVVLNEIKVLVDDGKLGEYVFTKESQISIDLKQKAGLEGKLSPGEHYFEFTIGELQEKKTYVQPGQSESIFTSPIFFGTIILVFIIMGAGSYLASQKKPQYYIDIPDFPPTEFKKIVIPKNVILNIFQKENEYHKWEETPITFLEIKNGLNKTFYKGNYLTTSDFNLYYILDKIKKKGGIIEELGYY
ncbi:MAG: hypothetical protein PHU63_02485, partial [Candidatus ainarchaeum sp.]|nr:hypothetical protein [Candidatus ainarchaeum sp.]